MIDLAGQLQPPRFTLRPAYNSLTVFVHQKPIWLKLFPSGVFYTIYLEQTGEDKKVIISKVHSHIRQILIKDDSLRMRLWF